MEIRLAHDQRDDEIAESLRLRSFGPEDFGGRLMRSAGVIEVLQTKSLLTPGNALEVCFLLSGKANSMLA